MTPTLHFSPGACSLAPHIILEEIGLPFDLTHVSTSDGSTLKSEHLKLNPKGRVPVLVSGDFVLTEAPAILIHLANAYPDRKLIAHSPDALVRSIEWFNWLSGTVHAVAIRQVWRSETFSEIAEHHDAIVEKGKKNLVDAFSHIESRLKGTDWAVGNDYSIVDAYLLVFYRWGNRIGFDMRNLYPSWTRQTLKVLERPATVRAMATEGISVWN